MSADMGTIRLTVLSVALTAVMPRSAAASPPSWTVQVDPLTTALGFVHVQVERRLTGELSVYAGPHLRLFDGIGAEDGEDYRGAGAELGVRWFVRGGAPVGYWAQVRGVAARVTSGDDAAFGGYVSALGGHTWLLGDRWIIALGLGVQYLHYAVGDTGTKGWFPAAHTALGVAF